MRIGLYPGSFDPVTYGHLDIIKRAAMLCDKLIVAVAYNVEKKSMFSVEERVEMLRLVCENINNIDIKFFNGLLVDFCKKMDISFIVRGLRATSDFEYEFAMANMNKELYEKIDTVFLMSSTEYSYLSSRVVKEVSVLGGDVSHFVPPKIVDFLKRKIS